MPTVFSIAEAIELSRLGKFDMLGADGIIPMGAAVVLPGIAPIPTTLPPALSALVGFTSGYRVLTERFNWGGTDAPNSVHYELHDEKGYYCGQEIKQSNQENHCTHICTSNYVILRLWNITNPPAQIYFDFSCWYYIWPEINDAKVMAIIERQPGLLSRIIDELSSIRQALRGVPPPLPLPPPLPAP